MLIKLEDVVDLPTEPYHPQRIQQLAVQCKAQRCYESQSRQLKYEGEKKFFALCTDSLPLHISMHCLHQWPFHSKIAFYSPACVKKFPVSGHFLALEIKLTCLCLGQPTKLLVLLFMPVNVFSFFPFTMPFALLVQVGGFKHLVKPPSCEEANGLCTVSVKCCCLVSWEREFELNRLSKKKEETFWPFVNFLVWYFCNVTRKESCWS